MTAITDIPYQPSRTLSAKLNRRFVQWRSVDRLPSNPSQGLISFTFDDFPRSAAETGADIVERFGGRGTYYACTGLAGSRTVCGEMYDDRHIGRLVDAGHEIGAHTASHFDCAKERTGRVLNDIAHNLDQLAAMGAPRPVRQFAYPYGETTLPLKRALCDRFTSGRGILPGLNGKGSDRMQLRAIEMTPDAATLDQVKTAIERAAREKLWLIVFTHDVSLRPSPFGVHSKHLSMAARAARDAGLKSVTIGRALKQVEAR